ncbi:MAG: cob(I)yrinic acid a,c-diamide adenosyltransferase [Oscillospiraceae bacterium]|nr:cob(I)yrinic acid a,c-diamide adenosyltransferase [Oscillospiraceae bacterium]
MIHLYHGDGKGKTTASVGLAVRAAGSGMRVLFVQFFKNGSSSEIGVLRTIPGIDVLIPDVWYGRYRKMTQEQQEETRKCYTSVMKDVADRAGDYDLIVLDEAVSAYSHGMFDSESFLETLKKWKGEREAVITGRDPAQELKDIADYVTEMKKEKHPFDEGIMARKGIEF